MTLKGDIGSTCHRWLHGYAKDKKTGELPKLEDVIKRAKSTNADGLNLSEKWPLDAAAVRQIKAAGLGCYAWTVDDPARARALVDAGVEGITTNRPAALRRELAAAP